MVKKIKKRDGRIVNFNPKKISEAIEKCIEDTDFNIDIEKVVSCADEKIQDKFSGKRPSVENIQDIVEDVLMTLGHNEVAKKYILYRQTRTYEREKKTQLMNVMHDIFNISAEENDMKRDNANTDTNSAMGTMLKIGSEASKDYYLKNVLKKEYADLHQEGLIHIHDLDFYDLTTTCTQLDLEKLLKNGFSTGNGSIRPPKSIRSATALVAIVLQSNQNDQHGGQSIANFDWDLAPYVTISYNNHYKNNLKKYCSLTYLEHNDVSATVLERISKASWEDTEKETQQAMEALIHNLNTMSSRAGAQTPFSSINFGLDTSKEGRLVSRCLIEAQKAGIGNGDTAIFPILIFRLKEGINSNPEDPNYDLFKLACECAAQRLFPCFAFVDAPFNLQYYDPNNKHTHVAYMGCRTRVMGNVYDPEREIVSGRGNLSFTSINLPMLALESKTIDVFNNKLKKIIDLCCDQLYDRYLIQRQRKVKNHPFLYGQGAWLDSDDKEWEDEVGDIINHGSLSVGFVGLAECLTVLIGKHHGESETSQELGIKTISTMREILDKRAEKTKLNYSLLATPAESYAGRALRLTRKKHGVIDGVTDKEYFTNSFHIPPSFNISIAEKISKEAPYHQYCNAGHITYVEFDGSAANNIPAFMSTIHFMRKSGIGYGAINVPLDKCGSCGYRGVIDDECPGCGKKESEGNKVQRIRRITGYLVGTLDRFNDSKRHEERDRVKHSY